jgi:hypothetical protein
MVINIIADKTDADRIWRMEISNVPPSPDVSVPITAHQKIVTHVWTVQLPHVVLLDRPDSLGALHKIRTHRCDCVRHNYKWCGMLQRFGKIQGWLSSPLGLVNYGAWSSRGYCDVVVSTAIGRFRWRGRRLVVSIVVGRFRRRRLIVEYNKSDNYKY